MTAPAVLTSYNLHHSHAQKWRALLNNYVDSTLDVQCLSALPLMSNSQLGEVSHNAEYPNN